MSDVIYQLAIFKCPEHDRTMGVLYIIGCMFMWGHSLGSDHTPLYSSGNLPETKIKLVSAVPMNFVSWDAKQSIKYIYIYTVYREIHTTCYHTVVDLEQLHDCPKTACTSVLVNVHQGCRSSLVSLGYLTEASFLRGCCDRNEDRSPLRWCSNLGVRVGSKFREILDDLNCKTCYNKRIIIKDPCH